MEVNLYLFLLAVVLWATVSPPKAAADPHLRPRRGLQVTPVPTPAPTPAPSSEPSLSSSPSDAPSANPSDVPSSMPSWSFDLVELDEAFKDMAAKFSSLENYERLNNPLPLVGKSINGLIGGSTDTLYSIIDFSLFKEKSSGSGVSRTSLESDLNFYMNTTLAPGSVVEVDTTLPGCENASDPIAVTFGTDIKETFTVKICSKISYSESLLLDFNGLFDNIGE